MSAKSDGLCPVELKSDSLFLSREKAILAGILWDRTRKGEDGIFYPRMFLWDSVSIWNVINWVLQ